MRAADHVEPAAEYAEYAELPRAARVLARLIPAGDREAILGDLIEDAGFRDLAGARRSLWLTGECAAIAAGLSIHVEVLVSSSLAASGY